MPGLDVRGETKSKTTKELKIELDLVKKELEAAKRLLWAAAYKQRLHGGIRIPDKMMQMAGDGKGELKTGYDHEKRTTVIEAVYNR